MNMWDTAEQTEQENRLWKDSKSIQIEYTEITNYLWCFILSLLHDLISIYWESL